MQVKLVYCCKVGGNSFKSKIVFFVLDSDTELTAYVKSEVKSKHESDEAFSFYDFQFTHVIGGI